MDRLPDDVLLRVFGFLAASPRDLLGGVRAVCRRWRALALHPELWRRRHRLVLWSQREGYRRDVRCVQEAAWIASLAPCARSMGLESALLLERKDVGRALLCSGCAVETLSLRVEHKGSGLAARLLERQLTLGRLRVLRLYLTRCTSYTLEKFVKILMGNTQLSDLELEIIIRYSSEETHPLASILDNVAGNGCSSLKRLIVSCGVRWDVWPVGEQESPTMLAALGLLLERFASSLERVHLEYGGSPKALAPVAALLSRCPRLREMRVHAVYLLTCWPHCAQITHLELDKTYDYNTDVDAVVPLLRSATQLTSLSLRSNDWTEDEVLKLVSALASSGQSRLEFLAIGRVCRPYESPSPDDCQVVSVLARLPRLRTLEFTLAPLTCFLEAFLFQPTLHLQLMEFGGEVCCPRRGPCDFAVLVALIRKWPELHASGLRHLHCPTFPPGSVPAECTCACCATCPPELRPHLNSKEKIGLCGCAAGRACKVRAKGMEWVQVGGVS